MVVTREQQEKLVLDYISKRHTQEEVGGFIDGIEAALELVDKLMRE